MNGKKGREMWENTLEEESRADMLKRILGGKRDKTFEKYGELKEVQEEKEVREHEARHNQKNNHWLENRKEIESS